MASPAPQWKDNSDDIIITLPHNIIVRSYRPTDAPSLSHHGNNKKIWNNLRNRMPHPYLETDAEAWISHCNSPSQHVRSGPYNPQTSTSSGPPIPTNYTISIHGRAAGSIGLEFGSALDVYARVAELGYWLGEEYWGKGVMGVVVPAFVEWAWRTFGRLVRINACVVVNNVGSKKALERAGLVEEGRKRWAFVKNGVLRDEVLMGMVRVEEVAVEDVLPA